MTEVHIFGFLGNVQSVWNWDNGTMIQQMYGGDTPSETCAEIAFAENLDPALEHTVHISAARSPTSKNDMPMLITQALCDLGHVIVPFLTGGFSTLLPGTTKAYSGTQPGSIAIQTRGKSKPHPPRSVNPFMRV